MDKLKFNYEIISDKAKNPVTTSEYIKHGNKWLNDAVNEATVEVTKKANKDYVDAELAKKANAADLTALETTVSGKADSSTVAGISDRVTQNTTKTVDLQSQIDALVISGGGDSNPEVVQARTDVSGITHATLKTRIDSEVTDLKSDLNKVFSATYGNYYELIEYRKNNLSDTALNDDGTTKTLANTTTTAFIDVEKYNKIKVTVRAGSSLCGVCFFDKDKTIVKSIFQQGEPLETHENVEIEVPNNAKYCRLSSYRTTIVISVCISYSEYQTIYNEKNTEITELIGKKDLDVTHNVFLTSDGREISFNGATVTDFIPVSIVDNFTIGLTYGSSVCGCCLYNKDKVCIGNISELVGETKETISNHKISVDSIDVAYIRFSSWYDDITVIERKPISEVIDSNDIYKNKKVTVIGDSITEHNSWANTNWNMYLAEWNKWEIQNLGIGGTGFAKSNPYINRISQIDSNTDIIGVACSFNDMSSDLEVGNITDTGTGTLCGYINDFFEELVMQFPTTPIICYCQSVWYAWRPGKEKSDAYINAIEEICKFRGIPFSSEMYYGSVLRPWNEVNLAMYFSKDDGSINNVHPNSKGHYFIAKCLRPFFEKNIK